MPPALQTSRGVAQLCARRRGTLQGQNPRIRNLERAGRRFLAPRSECRPVREAAEDRLSRNQGGRSRCDRDRRRNVLLERLLYERHLSRRRQGAFRRGRGPSLWRRAGRQRQDGIGRGAVQGAAGRERRRGQGTLDHRMRRLQQPFQPDGPAAGYDGSGDPARAGEDRPVVPGKAESRRAEGPRESRRRIPDRPRMAARRGDRAAGPAAARQT